MTSILVTGGTGSFGQRFVRTLLSGSRFKRIVVFSRDELKQSEMPRDERLRYFLGDVRDVDRLEMAFQGVEIVIHAAALKRIEAAEYNPFECVATNIMGTENVVRAALKTGVKRVILLSTDKAVSPVNLYGASKLAAEKIFVAANVLGKTRFSVVRYGNVVNSRGGVLDLFRKSRGPLPVTDERMTRFWMTLQQGVDFMLFCLDEMKGGEIFVPRIPSMRIIDLARCFSDEYEIVGIRPGEKLHETLVGEADARLTAEYEDYYVIGEKCTVGEDFRYCSDSPMSFEELRESIDERLQQPEE